MAMSLFNTMANWFIRKRIDQINNFIAHPIEVQNLILFSQLSQAKDTEYGKVHGFKDISSYREFQNQVPIVTYEEFEPYIEKARKGEKIYFGPGKSKICEIIWHYQCQKQIYTHLGAESSALPLQGRKGFISNLYQQPRRQSAFSVQKSKIGWEC